MICQTLTLSVKLGDTYLVAIAPSEFWTVQIPDEEVVGICCLLETGLFDSIPPRQGVEDFQQGHGVRDASDPFECRVNHVCVHYLQTMQGG